MRTIMAVLAMVLAAGVANAQPDQNSANFLLPYCEREAAWNGGAEPNPNSSYTEALMRGFCVGLVDGVAFADAQICKPDEVTIGQEVLVVIAYIEAA